MAAHPVSLAHLSLIGTSPEQLVRIAAEAGFDLVDLRLSPATSSGPRYSAAERFALCRVLAPILRDHGIAVWDVEIIRLNDQTDAQEHLPLIEAASLVGARRIKLVCDTRDHVRAAALLAELARLAQPFGLTLDLEYMVFSGVRSLEEASAIVTAASTPNLKILVDALHWVRAGDSMADLRGSPHLGYVQLCDGPLVGPEDRDGLIQEARTRRLVPGPGEFPLRALLAAMPEDCVASVEVPLPPRREPRAHARHLLEATRRLIQAMGSS